jgi:hypothetical protein
MQKLTPAELDALEAAHKAATPGEWQRHGSHIYGPDPERALIAQTLDWPTDSLTAIIAAHNALPALIAAARATVPEPIGEKHRDGNWWMVWHPEFEHWLKCRFWHDQWMVSGPAQLGLCTTPTHVLPMPPAPEAQ